MPVKVPPAANYPGPLISLPAIWNQAPSEGARFVPAEIDWGTSDNGLGAVSFNLAGNATQTISQIVALSVDNSQCGADIQFYFPDTSQTYEIPAYTPAAVFPVFTNQTQFYVTCLNALNTDVTRFAIHNALPPPSDIPTTQEQNVAGLASVPTNVVGNTQLVAAGTNGTIEDAFISCQMNGSANGSGQWAIVDGTGAVKAVGQVSSNNTINVNLICLQLTNVAIRFQNGLKFEVISSTLASGDFAVNLYYRTP